MTPGDVPRERLMTMAQEALDASPPGSFVLFKFTCEACGTRCTLAERNMLRERGECFACHHETTITEGGMTLVLRVENPQGTQFTAPRNGEPRDN